VPLDALALALAAALVHALWNLLTVRARDVQVAVGVALAVGAAAFAPVAVLRWEIDAAVAPYAVASVALELAYLALLATAYTRAPMSVVYPVARGAAPVIVLAISVLALGAAVPVGAALGVLAVASGVLLVRGGAGAAGRARAGQGGTALGLLVAACIAGYTLVDHAALAHAGTIAYLELVMAPTAALYVGAAVVLRGPGAVLAELRPPIAVAGLGMFGAYALALAALALADAAPVAAVRESSVVIATALAALVLREHVDRRRWAGAVLVALGVAAIALAG
jgi:drug/metabolite transporter (DMT)-like permease